MIRHCYLAKMEVAARRLNLKIKVSLQTAFDTFIETKKMQKGKITFFRLTIPVRRVRRRTNAPLENNGHYIYVQKIRPGFEHLIIIVLKIIF